MALDGAAICLDRLGLREREREREGQRERERDRQTDIHTDTQRELCA